MRITVEYWNLHGLTYKITTAWFLWFIPIFRKKRKNMEVRRYETQRQLLQEAV